MKIVLVNSGYKLHHDQPPLGLISLAGYVRSKGHEVKIVNRQLCESLEKCMKDFNPDVVGVTAITSTVADAYRCAEFSRRLGKYTVIGGVHASVIPDEAIQHCDAVVIGEGETKFTELIESRENGIFHGSPINNLDDLPIPAYDLIDMEYYTNARAYTMDPISILSFVPLNVKVSCLLTSRGCPFRCVFCYNSTRDYKVRYSSPEKVIEILLYLINNYGIQAACFMEDHFFVNRDRVKRIVELMDRNDIKLIWGGNSRADGLKEDVMEDANLHGCTQIAFGFESASQTVLNSINKQTTVEDNVNAVKLCDKYNIVCQGNVMINNLYEEASDVKMTFDFIANNNIDGGIGVSICTPLPGTKLWESMSVKPSSVNFYEGFNYSSIVSNMSRMSNEQLSFLVGRLKAIANVKFAERLPSRFRKINDMSKRMLNKEVAVKDGFIIG